jgi:hypothetical protein
VKCQKTVVKKGGSGKAEETKYKAWRALGEEN